MELNLRGQPNDFYEEGGAKEARELLRKATGVGETDIFEAKGDGNKIAELVVWGK
ncbi:hypothetical protein SDJN02_01989, partial [Cucurbita argyrosperma subsp. argyrosperma]